jgi:hypothetical protein
MAIVTPIDRANRPARPAEAGRELMPAGTRAARVSGFSVRAAPAIARAARALGRCLLNLRFLPLP